MRFEMMAMPRDEFDKMKSRLSKVTPEGLFETYRISQNTWYKLRDGLPVKRKTIERLRQRYDEVSQVVCEHS
jgi:hypothetical protein